MSGPKITVYSLTGEAKRIVLGQIRCMRASAACAGQIRELMEELKEAAPEVENALGLLELAQKRNGGQEEARGRARELLRRVTEARRAAAAELPAHLPEAPSLDVTRYRIEETALAEKERELQRLQELRDQLRELREAVRESLTAGLVQQEIVAEVRESIARDIRGAVSFDPADLAAEEEAALRERKRELADRLAALRDPELPPELTAEIRVAEEHLSRISQPDFVTSFQNVTVSPLERRAEAWRKEQVRKPEGPTDEEAAVLRAVEQSYIAECVDEVMAEMGYELIGRREVRKRSGRRFRNELYEFREGTAVNVTYAEDGQIAMELGGIAREDRVPSQEETAVLTREMEAFCGEFAEFERRMLARGIIVGSRVALTPPDAAYASIINVNDYETEDGWQITEIRGRRKKKERKALRKEL
ncbi:MAG: hypothetical protein IJH77_02555 [Mogibacterium sp.]|nr:hypothetical protein [Mogibacterium sp.]